MGKSLAGIEGQAPMGKEEAGAPDPEAEPPLSRQHQPAEATSPPPAPRPSLPPGGASRLLTPPLLQSEGRG